jgi:hypothetical protein
LGVEGPLLELPRGLALFYKGKVSIPLGFRPKFWSGTGADFKQAFKVHCPVATAMSTKNYSSHMEELVGRVTLTLGHRESRVEVGGQMEIGT